MIHRFTATRSYRRHAIRRMRAISSDPTRTRDARRLTRQRSLARALKGAG